MAIADQAGAQYLQNITNISKAFQPMDTNILNTALAQGGSLSGNLGFGEGGISVLGLSPEDVMNLTKQRGEIQNQNMGVISGMAALQDMLTGGKETRQALAQAQGHIFGAQSAEDLQGKRLGVEQEMQQAGFGQQSSENILNRAQQKAEADARVGEEKRFHDMVYGPDGLDYKKLEEETRNHKALETLKGQEMIALKNSADAATASGNTVGLVAKLGELKDKALGAITTGKGTVAGDLAHQDYFKYHMMEQALASPVGTVMDTKGYDATGGNYTAVAKGYPQLMLGPDGNWYGVKRDPKTNVISEASATPIVYNPINMSTASRKGTTTTLAKKHQP